MWYLDEYLKKSDLTARLYYCDNVNNNELDNLLLTGYLTNRSGFNITHNWTNKNDSFMQVLNFVESISSAWSQGKEAGKRISGALKSVLSGGDKTMASVTSDIIGNRMLSSNVSLFKKFSGSDVKISDQSMEIYLVTDSEVNNNTPSILNKLTEMFGNGALLDTQDSFDKTKKALLNLKAQFEKGDIKILDALKNLKNAVSGVIAGDDKEVINSHNMRFGGGFQSGILYSITTPPSKFRNTINYDPNQFVVGSYRLVTNRYVVNNLVLNNMSVEFSDSESSINPGIPIYAKVSLGFEYAKTPTQHDVYKLINSRPIVKLDNDIKIENDKYDQGIAGF